jgi:hypothetical protein
MNGAFADFLAAAANTTSSRTDPRSSGPAAASFTSNFFAFLLNLFLDLIAKCLLHIYKYTLEHPLWAAYDIITTALFFAPGAFMGPAL